MGSFILRIKPKPTEGRIGNVLRGAVWKWMQCQITLDAADRFVAQTHQHTHAADPAIVNTSKKCIVTFGNIHAVVRTLEI